MLYCLNPNCSHPENPDNNHFCQGCGAELAFSSQSYLVHDHYLLVQLWQENEMGRSYLSYDLNGDILQKPQLLQQYKFPVKHENIEEIKHKLQIQAQKLQKLNHFQIPKIYDYFTDDNACYLVQEWIEGQNLLEEIRQGKTFNEDNILPLLRDLLLILQYLHKNKVLHRDICPENLVRPHSSLVNSIPNDSQKNLLERAFSLPIASTNRDVTPSNYSQLSSSKIPQISPDFVAEISDNNLPSTEPNSLINEKELEIVSTKNSSKNNFVSVNINDFINLAFKANYSPDNVLWTAPFSIQLVGLIFRSQLNNIPLVFWQVVLLSEFLKAYQEANRQELLSLERGQKIILMGVGKTKLLSIFNPDKEETDFYSPIYASPEQMRGECSPATDIYSLGVTCIRLLTGCFPQIDLEGKIIDPLYDSENKRWLWREQLEKQNKYIGFQLRCALDRMLSSFPEHRYQSTTEILNFLFPIDPAYSQRFHDKEDLKRRRLLKLMGWGTVGVMTTFIIGSWIVKRGKPWEKYLKPFNFVEIQVNAQGQIINNQPRRSQFVTVEINEETSIDFVPIPGGKFLIGSPATERGRQTDEQPQQVITVSSFFMSKYPVTQAQWVAVMGINPSFFLGENLPVDKVSWYDCQEFCRRLSDIVGRRCRMPTEAEWEYACRAGTATPFHFGETLTSDLANYKGNSLYQSEPRGEFRQRTTDVGSFPPNRFGLYDLHGNVWEWCLDTKQENYNGIPSNGSPWITNRSSRILRGGAWLNDPYFCRSANRNHDTPNAQFYSYGCRVVAEVKYRIHPLS